MDIRYAVSPMDVKNYDTKRLRENFLIEKVFYENELRLVYSHEDRIIVGGLVCTKEVKLTANDELRAPYFLYKREMGIINIGGEGKVTVDGKEYILKHKNGLYIGMGKKDIIFNCVNEKNPPKFYINSCPAHKEYKTTLIKFEDDNENNDDAVVIKKENKVELGTLNESNHRVINKYILPGQVESCQLVMGMTILKDGFVWNTMPCHTHDRRMEVYLYFELPDDAIVMHYMGEPQETRHVVIRNEQAIISPSWSIHAASATRSYVFIWGMCGENQTFDDMDKVKMQDIM